MRKNSIRTECYLINCRELAKKTYSIHYFENVLSTKNLSATTTCGEHSHQATLFRWRMGKWRDSQSTDLSSSKVISDEVFWRRDSRSLLNCMNIFLSNRFPNSCLICHQKYPTSIRIYQWNADSKTCRHILINSLSYQKYLRATSSSSSLDQLVNLFPPLLQ